MEKTILSSNNKMMGFEQTLPLNMGFRPHQAQNHENITSRLGNTWGVGGKGDPSHHHVIHGKK